MPKNKRPLWIVPASFLLLATATAGCAKGADPKVVTANPGATTSAGPAGSGEASLLKFSQCMRDQGFSWYPDPQSDGGLVVHNPDGVDQAKLAKAEDACKKYQPGQGRQGPIPAEDLKKVQQVSQCMRDHGFAKYPDPDANGSLTIDSQALGAEPGDPAFQKAMRDCQKFMPAPKSKGNS
ncbi:MAG: hypothetical protein QOI78_7335 [Actinomycetota bacterium]|jgi:hypothetical protein|nr:hypothetical protein [Actinomycetota bacterium]